MSLKEYLKTIKKIKCPQKCKFKTKGGKIAKVPPPKKILGVVISQDPTLRWWHLYKYFSENEPQEDIRRKILFASAIPILLIYRVLEFMKKPISNKDEKNLFNMIFRNVYWTHLHKCFTDASEKKSLKFNPKNAELCANKWLKEELNIAINDNIKFIIALGNDVQKWTCEWREDYCKNKNIKIIYLPHPSPANVGRYLSWHPKEPKNREKIEEQINCLLKLCKTVT